MGRFRSLLSRTLKNFYLKNWSNNLRFCWSIFAKTIQTEGEHFRSWKKKLFTATQFFWRCAKLPQISPFHVMMTTRSCWGQFKPSKNAVVLCLKIYWYTCPWLAIRNDSCGSMDVLPIKRLVLSEYCLNKWRWPCPTCM